MFCTKCGNRLNDGDAFCGVCGSKQQVTPPKQQPTLIKKFDSKKCEVCGGSVKETMPGQYVCEYCGSEYTLAVDGSVAQCTLTDKEVLDVFYEAAMYERNNKPFEELQCLLKAIDKAPNNVALLVKLGRAYRRNNLYSKALECYEKAMAINPGYGTAYSNASTVYTLTQNYEKAVKYSEKAVQLIEQNREQCTKDDYAVSLSNYALALKNVGRKAEAKIIADKAIKNGYQNGKALKKLLKQ